MVGKISDYFPKDYSEFRFFRPSRGHKFPARLCEHSPAAQAILEHKEMFAEYRPSFLIVADREKIALIEIALEEKYSVKVTDHYHLTRAS